MEWKRRLHRILRRTGYDVLGYVPIAHPLARRKKLMDHLAIDLVLDVGANEGQFGRQLREIGYRGRIVSFEPLSAAHAILEKRAARDGAWTALPYALGDQEGEAELQVAAKNVFSSLHRPEGLLRSADSEAIATSTERVSIRRLDACFEDVRGKARAVWLKLDVQGHEADVLQGATHSLRRVAAIQMEMSLAPLYGGERGIRGHLEWAEGSGFELWALEPGFSDGRTGRLLQADGIFLPKVSPT